MPLFVRWAIALAFTQMVEAPIYATAIGGARPTRERWAIALAASFITHPLVWFVIPELVSTLAPGASHWSAIAVAETFAVTAEALWLALFGVRYALPLALLANGASFTLGLFAYVFLAW
ncbi:MAG: hypothetical protein K1X94_09170 [Sandaracinaceae bacterium]|nr:hypothetical protein [Sandaracinaceae bacterium]